MKKASQLFLGLVGPRPRKPRRYTEHQMVVQAARDREAHEKRKGGYIDPRVAAALRGVLRRIG